MDDVEKPSKTGCWIFIDGMMCSECEHVYVELFEICPNCGAIMEVEAF